MLAEEFHLPENRRIVVTDDMPACALSEYKFLAAAEEDHIQFRKNSNVALFCCDPEFNMPETNDRNWHEFCENGRHEMDSIETVILKVRKMAVKIQHGLPTGIICDGGLLHGFIAYEPPETCQHNINFVAARPFKVSKVAGDGSAKLPDSIARFIKKERLIAREQLLRLRSDRKAYYLNSALWKAKMLALKQTNSMNLEKEYNVISYE